MRRRSLQDLRPDMGHTISIPVSNLQHPPAPIYDTIAYVPDNLQRSINASGPMILSRVVCKVIEGELLWSAK
jgi:hypothetical protein